MSSSRPQAKARTVFSSHLANLKGGALQKVASKLVSLGFAEEVKVGRDNPAWRTDDVESIGLNVIAAGLQAIGVQPGPEDSAEMSAASGESATPQADTRPQQPAKEREGTKARRTT